MNGIALFAAGVVVTLIVAAALALLVWGAILDGREEARQRAARLEGERPHLIPHENVRPITDGVPPHAA